MLNLFNFVDGDPVDGDPVVPAASGGNPVAFCCNEYDTGFPPEPAKISSNLISA